MKTNGDITEADQLSQILDDLPLTIRQLRSGKASPLRILEARGALMDACEGIVAVCAKEARAMKAEESRRVETCMEQLSEINALLAEYKRRRNSDNDSALPVILPF